MTIDFQIILITLLTTLYFILPAYFANGGALVFGGGTPIDFGKSDSNGVRWVGDGVTWRGMIVGTIIGMITGAVQGYIAPMILPYIRELDGKRQLRRALDGVKGQHDST